MAHDLNLNLELWGDRLPHSITQQLINYAENDMHVPPSYLITLLHYESLWGRSSVGQSDNNWAGMTWGGWSSPHTRPSGVVVTRGTARPVNEGGFYIRYKSVQDFLTDWTYLLSGSGYNVKNSDTFQSAVHGMFQVGGATYDYATMNVSSSQRRYELYYQNMSARRTAINNANNSLLTTLDNGDYSTEGDEEEDKETPPDIEPVDPPDENVGGIDFLDILKKLENFLKKEFSMDMYQTGQKGFYRNSSLILIKQMENMYKVKLNKTFMKRLEDLFSDFNNEYIPPEQTNPDPEPNPDPDPDPGTNEKVFPVRIQNGVNFFKRSNWGIGTLQRNMTYGQRSTGTHHYGYDIGGGNNEAKPIYSVAKGTVRKSEYRSGIGNAVTIEHDNDIYFVEYGHLASRSVSVGDKVNAGQQIGTMGATGGNYAVHLDLKIATTLNGFYSYDTTIDPEQYLQVNGDNSTRLPQP